MRSCHILRDWLEAEGSMEEDVFDHYQRYLAPIGSQPTARPSIDYSQHPDATRDERRRWSVKQPRRTNFVIKSSDDEDSDAEVEALPKSLGKQKHETHLEKYKRNANGNK